MSVCLVIIVCWRQDSTNVDQVSSVTQHYITWVGARLCRKQKLLHPLQNRRRGGLTTAMYVSLYMTTSGLASAHE